MKDIHFNNWVTDTSSQNFHKFFDNIHYHNIHRQTWCKLWNISSKHLQQFYETSSTILWNISSSHQIIFENRSSKLFKHFIECRSSSQHLFQHSFHISFQQTMKQYFITTIEWQIFHNILSKYFITTNWVTDISQHTF